MRNSSISDQDDQDPLDVMRGLATKASKMQKEYTKLESITYTPDFPRVFIVDGRSKAQVEHLFSHLNIVSIISLPEEGTYPTDYSSTY